MSTRRDAFSNRIFCRDARDMREVPDGSVHLVVTSPPYNVAKNYTDHNDSLSLGEYTSMLGGVWRECYRVLAPGGRLCINVANTDRKPYLSLVSLIDEQLRTSAETWLHRGHIIWDKGASAGVSTAWGSFGRASNPTLRDVHEYITIWCKDQFRLESAGDAGPGPFGDGITGNQFVAWTRSVWRPETLMAELQRKIAEKLADARRRSKDDAWIAESIARAVWGQALEPGRTIWEMTTESAVNHPAPFPVELPRRLIELYTHPGDLVLDPFMGSGSTAIAAVLTGRGYVGYELSAEYCVLAEARILEVKGRKLEAGCQ